MRLLFRAVLIVSVLSSMVSADTKIKTRRTVMGHSMEDTVYVKGARQRTEQAGMMGMPGTTTILQCDQKRIIRINVCTKTYMVEPLGTEMGGATGSPGAVAAEEAGAPRGGGVVSIVNSANDTGERQKMFGLEARHVKSSMAMEPGPGACAKEGMKMERDGWYVNLSPQLTCEMGPHQLGPAMGPRGRGPACRDSYRLKNTGSARAGFPLKETLTFMAEGRPFSMTTEVTELSTANLNPALFEIPQGYRQVNDYMAMMGDPRAMMSGGCSESQGIPVEMAGAPAEEKPAPAPEPAPAAKPAVSSAPPKAAGVLRVGIVKILDKSNTLPVVNLRLNLMSEITLRQMEAIPLDSTDTKDALDECKEKSCDYVLFTEAVGVTDPGQPPLPVPGRVVKAAANPDDFNAKLDLQLFRMIRPQLPELKASIAGAAPVRAVDAVMNGFENEAQAVREQIDKDLHPQKATPAAKKPLVRKK